MHTQPKQMPDEQLITLYQYTQKREYFAPLYNRYVKKIQSKCLRMIGDTEVAKDLTQDIFLKALDKLNAFQCRSSFSTWLYRIAHNYCLESIRSNQQIRLESITHPFDHQADDSQESLLIEQYYLQFRQWIDQLSLIERTILELRYEKKYSIKEISKDMALSESAVKMRLKRSRERLKLCHDYTYLL